MKRLAVILLVSCMVMIFTATAAMAFPAVEVYKKTSKSVVLIVAGNGDGGNMVGAGSLVSPDGHIVTNAHVVIDKDTNRPFKTVRVFIKPEEVTGDLKRDLVNRYKARVISYDVDLDLALVKAEDLPRDVRPVELANPRDIMVGEEVVAIGHPEQGGLWTLTYGRISGQIANQGDVKGKDVYQTDTSVNRGNSGGPLLDRRGYIVGVNTNIARVGEGNLPITGVNFALKSAVVKHWMAAEGYQIAYGQEALSSEETPVRGRQAEAAPAPEQMAEQPKQAEPSKQVEPVQMKEEPAPMKSGEPAPMKAEPEPMKTEPEPMPKAVEQEPAPKMAEPMMAEPEMSEPKASDEGNMAQENGEFESDEVITPKRPFSYDDLFEEVEREMEDMMDEMRMKIRNR